MKKLTSTLGLILIVLQLIAQTPQGFKYQTVVRDNTGEILTNQFISLQISIHDGSAGGTIVYQETHDVTTNQFGLANLKIGNGIPIGTFTSIDWGLGLKFLEVALDPTGGNTYISMGTSQLLSVPYAMYAETSSTDGDWIISGNDIYTNLPGNVGIGTPTPLNGKLEVVGDGNTGIYTSSATSNALQAESSAGGGFAAGFFNATNPGTYGLWAQSSEYEALYANTSSPTHPAIRASGTIAGVFEGNVGIGTSNPLYELDVYGIISTENPYHINGNKVLSIDGTANVMVGKGAGGNNTGSQSTFIGDSAGYNNQSTFNLFAGTYAGYTNSTGYHNTFLGSLAGYSNSDGIQNTFIGNSSGISNTLGNFNTYLGCFAGLSNTGSNNIFLGHSSGGNNLTGVKNTFIGTYSGVNNTGDANVFIGYEAGYNETGSNKLIIANGTLDENTLMYGDFVSGNLGIGTKELNHKLNINGNAVFTGEDGWDDPGDQANLFLGDPNHGIRASFGEGLRLWTFDDPNHAIRFQNHTGTDYMTIQMGSGNVGIGTSSPINGKLEVMGGANPGIYTSSTGSNAIYSESNAGGGYAAGFFNATEPGTYGILTQSSDYEALYAHTSSPTHPAIRATGNIAGVFDGKVGIGTTEPSSLLDVVGGEIQTDFGLKLSTTGKPCGNLIYNSIYGLDIINVQSTDIRFSTDQTDCSGIVRMVIKNDGKIGIGTTEPSYQLDVDLGNVLIQGTNSFVTTGDQGILYLGSVHHSITGEYGYGIKIGTYAAADALNIREITGNVGIGTTTPSQRLTVFNGSTTGTYTTSGWQHSSDERLKTNICQIDKALEKVMNMQGVYFDWKDKDEKHQVGLIAQDMEKVLPEVVNQDQDGYYSVSYGGVVPVLIEAIKGQQEMINKQQSQIEELKNMISTLVK